MVEGKTIKFAKMQGTGNDFVVINCFNEKLTGNLSELAKKTGDRHFGIGSDGFILIMPSEKADFKMRMFNTDGSEAEMCGNGIRCVGKYVYDKGLTNKTSITVETLGGIKVLDLTVENSYVIKVKVDMGEPVLEPEKIPVVSNGKSFIAEPIEINEDYFILTCVSMGNPHAVAFVDDLSAIPIERVGPLIEKYKIFPRRINVEFVRPLNKDMIEIRIWERGVGETLACGTGACGSFVASVLNNVCNRKATVKLPGGELQTEWSENDNHVYMTGPAEFVFEGEYYYS